MKPRSKEVRKTSLPSSRVSVGERLLLLKKEKVKNAERVNPEENNGMNGEEEPR